MKNSDKQNARIEHDKALARVMTAVLKDDTELFKQFSDNESFRRWLTDTIFAMTYEDPGPEHELYQPQSCKGDLFPAIPATGTIRLHACFVSDNITIIRHDKRLHTRTRNFDEHHP